jgi:hypothetical protein
VVLRRGMCEHGSPRVDRAKQGPDRRPASNQTGAAAYPVAGGISNWRLPCIAGELEVRKARPSDAEVASVANTNLGTKLTCEILTQERG